MTAENFQACLAFTLKYEGGKSNDPRDPGGRTMEGVTQATYDASHEKKALGLRDVFTMGAAERDEIYRNEYWNAVNGDRASRGRGSLRLRLRGELRPRAGARCLASLWRLQRLSPSHRP